MITSAIDIPTEQIASFCRKWKIREFALFGSILRDDFGPSSDIDVLVTFDESARWGLWDVIEAEQELTDLWGRKVDLIDRRGVENSENRERDYDEKREEYERIGVKEYVIVDRFDRRLTVLRLVGDSFAESTLGPDDTYTTPLLPGLEIPLQGIL